MFFKKIKRRRVFCDVWVGCVQNLTLSVRGWGHTGTRPPPSLLHSLILHSKLNIFSIRFSTEKVCHSCLKAMPRCPPRMFSPHLPVMPSGPALVPLLTAWFLPVSQTLCLRPGCQFGLHQFLAVRKDLSPFAIVLTCLFSCVPGENGHSWSRDFVWCKPFTSVYPHCL